MKKKIICKAGYIVFSIMCFALCGVFPDLSVLFFRVWYVMTIIVWCAVAIDLLSLSLKSSKAKRQKRKSSSGKEKKE